MFNGENLVDCEFLEDGGEFSDDFVDKFTAELNFIRKEKLSSTKHAKHHQYHEDLNVDDEVLEMKPNVKFIQLKRLQDVPEHMLEMMNLKKLKKKCNQLHRQIKQRLREQNGEDLSGEENELENTKR